MTLRRWSAPAALATFLVASATSADEAPKSPASLPSRQAHFTWDDASKTLQVTVSYRDALDGEVLRKVQSGLPTTVVFHAYLYAEGADTPVAATFRSCRVAYDIWNEVYRMHITQPGGDTQSVALNLEGVMRRCAETKALPVADRHLLAAGRLHFLAAMVEVNPVSPDMLDRIRRWVSRPPGSGPIAPGDALFGSFVGLFVARIGAAERSLAFRTQTTAPR